MTQRPPMPTEERRPAWRRACLAYREMREAGRSDQEAHEAAVMAVLEALPGLPWKEASAEAVNGRPYRDHFLRASRHRRVRVAVWPDMRE